MPFLPHVVRAKYEKDFRIRLTFNDGVEASVDFSTWLDGPVFEPLQKASYFRKFFLDGGTVVWPNGADVAPETLYQAATRSDPALQSTRQDHRAAAAERERWLGNTEILADFLGESSLISVCRGTVDVLPVGLTKIEWLARAAHALTLRDSLITGPLPVACWASSQLASNAIATASWRLARASSRVAPCVLAPESSSREHLGASYVLGA